MIDVVPAEVAIENYAQVVGPGGSWMEWDNRRHRDADDASWPPPRPPDFPFPPPGEPWAEAFQWEGEDDEGENGGKGGGSHWQRDFPGADDPWEDTQWGKEDEDDGGCECGGPPPPVFNLPPPPPIPRILEEGEEEGSGCDAPPPAETCPALLVAGNAHTHQRLHPPIAALVVAAATFTLVFIIAALVCWRYRRQRGRRGPTKSSSDLTNGIIYEDLPSGPTPRVVPSHTHPGDTHTLAPMELLDMKLTSQVPTTTYGGAESTTPSLLQQCQSPHALSPTYSHGRMSPTFGHVPTPPPYSPKQPFDPRRSCRSSQELYNPTYEEISTGSDTTSVSSASVSSEGAETPQPRESMIEGPGPPGGWSSHGTCSCSGGRRPSQGRRGMRGGRARKARASSSATSTGTTEGSEYHEALVSHLVPSLAMKTPSSAVRHPTLPYTIQGTSDGRTSTSSSSDLPVDRCVAPREPRYYVGIPPPMARSPATPEGPGRGPPGLQFGDSIEGSSGTSTCGADRPSPTERGLPPLPSRSDRYRIYFTTDRRRAAEVAPMTSNTRTLDPSARKRQRRHDANSTLENEPLYHEL